MSGLDTEFEPDATGLCERCGAPKERTLGHVRYCLDCSGHAYREGIRNRKRKGGSREQYDQILALWRDGTLAKVLEQASGGAT